MKFSLFNLELEGKVFKFFAYTFVIFVGALTIGIISVFYMDYDYFKYKIENRSQPYIYKQSHQESIET